VIALSLVFFGARYLTPLYQTLALLVFAYVVRFFPQALSGVESSLERVNPRLEEAARGLGRGPVATALQVTVPLVRSGLLAGAALVFLSAMKELPATLLLRPIGFDTLATEVWRFTSVGAYSQAALPALLLIGVSAPFLYLVSAERRPGGGASG
jgi:iron(III) transport system permease protein